jgi:hypothetical protein
MAKIRQREWAIPGQRTKRKAWRFVTAMPGKHRSSCQRTQCAGCYQVRRFQSEWSYEDAVKALAEVMRVAPAVAQSNGLSAGR